MQSFVRTVSSTSGTIPHVRMREEAMSARRSIGEQAVMLPRGHGKPQNLVTEAHFFASVFPILPQGVP
jgi:hypothetical protein